jgi:hypothetical protein
MGQNRQKTRKTCLLTPSTSSRRIGAGMNESEKQFSFTRAASSTSGRAKNQIPIIHKQSLVCFPSPLFYAQPAASSRRRHGPQLRF